MDRAQQRYEAGRRFYLGNDVSAARREFDAAVDLMIEASSEDPGNRAEYDRKFESLIDSIHRLDLAGMGAASNPEDEKFEKAPLEDILNMTFPVDPKLNDKIREQVKASVSAASPLRHRPRSQLHQLFRHPRPRNSGGRLSTLRPVSRHGRAGFSTKKACPGRTDPPGAGRIRLHSARRVPRGHAGGMWQFLTWRGQEYGLQQTRYTDDRMDPEKATRAAARHLHDLYSEFGDWYLAIAAYNCGPVNVERAVERTGYADFWELRSRGALPAETTAYVPIILAFTIMEKNAAAYGLQGLNMDAAIEYDNIKTTSVTSLDLVADITGVSATEIAALNPAALHNLVPEGYTVHVPKGMGSQTTAALARVPAEKQASWRMHRVESDETVATIAKRYGVQAANLLAVNKLSDAKGGDRRLAVDPHRSPGRTGNAPHPTARATASRSTHGKTRGLRAPPPAPRR